MTKSASANASVDVEPVTSAFSRLARSWLIRPLPSRPSISPWTRADPGVDPVLVEVGEDHGHLEPLGEQQGELGGHQAGADDADLVTGRASARSGAPAGRLARFCTRSNA